MLERIEHGWRFAATALSFVCFGLGGLVLWLVLFPALALLLRDRRRLARAARAVIRQSFRAFVALMHGLGVLSYEAHGLARLQRRGLLILANHPSLIDVVFLMAFTARADCVVKAALLRNPFTRGPVRAAGFICNDSGPQLVQACVASLRAGNNLIIFPEGTRTPVDGSLLKLQRGASNIAVRAVVDITPVLIACRPALLTKGAPWWRVPRQRPHFRIEVREDLPVAALLRDCRGQALAARRLTEQLTGYFSTEVGSDRKHANA